MESFGNIKENFDILDNWEERYKYIISLGDKLPKLDHYNINITKNKVDGCISQVWLTHQIKNVNNSKYIYIYADSDSHIVKGILYIIISLFFNKNIDDIKNIIIKNKLATIGLEDNISTNRRNGMQAIVNKINTIIANNK